MAAADVVEKKVPEIDSALVDQAVKLIKTQGYATRKDFEKLQDNDWARQFTQQISDAFHAADEAPYIYYERFDFTDHEISGIVFDMDQIKTRAAAGIKLGEVLGLKSF
ncbi:hypothetical protein [Loigolactobacillus jiayinensis]|uniref:Uncharacterized protein n=1 Tax=Loigolactobacillus jiayinensis TaxID=2486016 RepID=A0ABW1REI5_9LACO|nr:hypothetical protein [Loigolactobacillus jiayinensis]